MATLFTAPTGRAAIEPATGRLLALLFGLWRGRVVQALGPLGCGFLFPFHFCRSFRLDPLFLGLACLHGRFARLGLRRLARHTPLGCTLPQNFRVQVFLVFRLWLGHGCRGGSNGCLFLGLGRFAGCFFCRFRFFRSTRFRRLSLGFCKRSGFQLGRVLHFRIGV